MATIAHILLTHTSHTTEGYTYIVPVELMSSLESGMLVEVEFSNGKYLWIVAATTVIADTDPALVGLKKILKILTKPLLTIGQISAILAYAQYHILQVHQVLGLYLPAPFISRILKYGLEDTERTLKSKSPPWESLLYFKTRESLDSYLQEAIVTPGTVIIAPSDPSIGRLMGSIDPKTQNIGVLTSSLTDVRRSQLWMDIFNGKYITCIWTRRLALYNLSRYSRIIYLEESLVPEILGHFHAYSVRELIRQSIKWDNKPLEFASLTPSVDLAARAIAKELPLINIVHVPNHEIPRDALPLTPI